MHTNGTTLPQWPPSHDSRQSRAFFPCFFFRLFHAGCILIKLYIFFLFFLGRRRRVVEGFCLLTSRCKLASPSLVFKVDPCHLPPECWHDGARYAREYRRASACRRTIHTQSLDGGMVRAFGLVANSESTALIVSPYIHDLCIYWHICLDPLPSRGLRAKVATCRFYTLRA